MKFSIVTPSFNQGEFIERTLDSVALQRNSAIEIEHVIFDGGSQDVTVSILEQWGDRIRWVSEKDKGQTDAVNKGIKSTNGEIIGWLNSDDVYYPGALECVARYFSDHPEIDMVYGQADHIDKQDRPFEDYPTEPWNFVRLMETCFICQPAVFMRRRVIDQYGLLDESLQYCMDYEYWLRLGLAGASIGYLEYKLAGSRLYQETKTLGARVKVHAETNDMFRQKFGSVPDSWLYNFAHMVVMHEPWVPSRRGSILFNAQLIAVTLYASIRWNGKISRDVAMTSWNWGKPTPGRILRKLLGILKH
jgi:glycosyltransferase involved in cell wall biosynthesis